MWHHFYTIESLWLDLKEAFSAPPRHLSEIHAEEEAKGKRKRASSTDGEWVYAGEEGAVQGPFTNGKMVEWNLNGHLPKDLTVRRCEWEEMFSIEKLWDDHGEAFRATPRDLGQFRKVFTRKLEESDKSMGIIPADTRMFGKPIVIGSVVPGSWAALNELHEGDRIFKLNGNPMESFETEKSAMKVLSARPLEITVSTRREIEEGEKKEETKEETKEEKNEEPPKVEETVPKYQIAEDPPPKKKPKKEKEKPEEEPKKEPEEKPEFIVIETKEPEKPTEEPEPTEDSEPLPELPLMIKKPPPKLWRPGSRSYNPHNVYNLTHPCNLYAAYPSLVNAKTMCKNPFKFFINQSFVLGSHKEAEAANERLLEQIREENLKKKDAEAALQAQMFAASRLHAQSEKIQAHDEEARKKARERAKQKLAEERARKRKEEEKRRRREEAERKRKEKLRREAHEHWKEAERGVKAGLNAAIKISELGKFSHHQAGDLLGGSPLGGGGDHHGERIHGEGDEGERHGEWHGDAGEWHGVAGEDGDHTIHDDPGDSSIPMPNGLFPGGGGPEFVIQLGDVRGVANDLSAFVGSHQEHAERNNIPGSNNNLNNSEAANNAGISEAAAANNKETSDPKKYFPTPNPELTSFKLRDPGGNRESNQQADFDKTLDKIQEATDDWRKKQGHPEQETGFLYCVVL